MSRTAMYMNVKWEVIPELEEVRRKLEILYHGRGSRLIITSARDSQHGIGTLHHSGRAFDFLQDDKVKESEIKINLCTGCQLVNEADKGIWHIEMDV